MVAAMIYPSVDEKGRGKKGVAATHFPMVSRTFNSFRALRRLALVIGPAGANPANKDRVDGRGR